LQRFKDISKTANWQADFGGQKKSGKKIKIPLIFRILVA